MRNGKNSSQKQALARRLRIHMNQLNIFRKQISQSVSIRPAVMGDAEAVTELFNQYSIHYSGAPEYTTEELQSDWDVPEFQLATDTQVLLLPTGKLIGYGDLWGSSTTLMRQSSWIRVHSDYLDSEIDRYLHCWVENRATENIDKAPPDTQVILDTSIFANDSHSIQLLQDLGRNESRRAWTMSIPLDDSLQKASNPKGIEIRSMLPGEEKAIYTVHRDAFRDHWGHIEEPFDKGYEKWLAIHKDNPKFDPSFWFVAKEANATAGFLLCAPGAEGDPEGAVVDLVGVGRAWRKRGIGHAPLIDCASTHRHADL